MPRGGDQKVRSLARQFVPSLRNPVKASFVPGCAGKLGGVQKVCATTKKACVQFSAPINAILTISISIILKPW